MKKPTIPISTSRRLASRRLASRRLTSLGLTSLVSSVVLLAMVGCASTPGPQPIASLRDGDLLFAAGDYRGAARAYAAYLEARPDAEDADRPLFRLAVIHLLPDSPVEDWKAARAFCRKIVDAFPQSPYRPQAEVLLHLQTEVERLYHQLQELKRIDLQGARPAPNGGT